MILFFVMLNERVYLCLQTRESKKPDDFKDDERVEIEIIRN